MNSQNKLVMTDEYLEKYGWLIEQDENEEEDKDYLPWCGYKGRPCLYCNECLT